MVMFVKSIVALALSSPFNGSQLTALAKAVQQPEVEDGFGMLPIPVPGGIHIPGLSPIHIPGLSPPTTPPPTQPRPPTPSPTPSPTKSPTPSPTSKPTTFWESLPDKGRDAADKIKNMICSKEGKMCLGNPFHIPLVTEDSHTCCDGYDCVRCKGDECFLPFPNVEGKCVKEKEIIDDMIDNMCTKEGSFCAENPFSFGPKSNCCEGLVCNDSECKKGESGEINAWKGATSFIPIESKNIPSECNLRDYDVTLTSSGKPSTFFFLSATVSNKVASGDKCPQALAFVSMEGRKTMFLIPSLNEMKPGDNEIYSHSLGKASLGEIMKAEASVDAVQEFKYNSVDNSSVDYAQDIWRALDFDETNELANFLIENILRDGSLAQYAKENVKQTRLRVLSNFDKTVKEAVLSQLDIN